MIRKLLSSSLFKSTGIYSLSNIINAAIPMLMLPILTRYLTPFDYGIVSMYTVLIGIVAPFTGLSIHGGINRQYYEKNKIDLAVYIYNCILLLLVSTGIVAVVFWAFSDQISQLSAFPESWLWAIILASVSQFIIQILLVMYQVQVKPVLFGAFQISNTVLNLSLSIWFVVGLKYNWQGRIEAQVIVFGLFAILALLLLYKDGWIKPKFNPSYIKHAVNFGVPVIPHALGAIIISFVDRVFITNMVGITATGIYTVGYQISMIMSLLSDSFNKAWVPWLYSKLKLEDMAVKIKIVKFTYGYFIVILVVALLLAAGAPILLAILAGPKFQTADQFVIWLVIGYAFNGMYKMVTNYIFYVEKTKFLTFSTFVAAIINIGLNYVLIKLNGAVGAAQATCIAFLLSFLLTWFISAKVYKMPWSLKTT